MKSKHLKQFSKHLAIQMLECKMAGMGFGEGFPTYTQEQIISEVLSPTGLDCVDMSGFKMRDENGQIIGFINAAFVSSEQKTLSAAVVLIHENRAEAAWTMSYPPLTETGRKAFNDFVSHVERNILRLDDSDKVIDGFMRKIGPIVCGEVKSLEEVSTTTQEN